jgi:hypothetical protein
VAHIPSSSLLLYLGVTLLAQQLVLQVRVNRLAQQPVSAGSPNPMAGIHLTPAGDQPADEDSRSQ